MFYLWHAEAGAEVLLGTDGDNIDEHLPNETRVQFSPQSDMLHTAAYTYGAVGQCANSAF